MTEIKRNKRADLSLMQLADGRYQVVSGGDVVLVTGVESLAQITYDELLEEKDPAKTVRANERAHYEMQAVRSDAFERRAGHARKKGGKGGRGGV